MLGTEGYKSRYCLIPAPNTPTLVGGDGHMPGNHNTGQYVLAEGSRGMEGTRWPVLHRTEQLGLKENFTEDGIFGPLRSTQLILMDGRGWGRVCQVEGTE